MLNHFQENTQFYFRISISSRLESEGQNEQHSIDLSNIFYRFSTPKSIKSYQTIVYVFSITSCFFRPEHLVVGFFLLQITSSTRCQCVDHHRCSSSSSSALLLSFSSQHTYFVSVPTHLFCKRT